MSAHFVGPVIRAGAFFTYPIFDGKVVIDSFSYLSIDQARYARDREEGRRLDTMDDFDAAVATI
jgi:hypothetical protein